MSQDPSIDKKTYVPQQMLAEQSSEHEPTQQFAATSASSNQENHCQQLGEYRIIRLLGAGGMGNVYLAMQDSLNRPVAIKTLKPDNSANPDFIDRFYKEARAMARVDHLNIVRCYSISYDEAAQLHYVVMEYVDGESLFQVIKKHQKLSPHDVATIAYSVADALHHAHARGIIHRDIKPDNLMVTQEGVIKVSDLGLAKALDENYSATSTGVGMGTPYYMAPEQARNAKHVDHRADMHALGCTLYRLVCGELPFYSTDLVEVIQSKVHGRYKALRRMNPAIPERLEWIIDRLMAGKIESRYSDWSDVMADLKATHLIKPGLDFQMAAKIHPNTQPAVVSEGLNTQPNQEPTVLAQRPTETSSQSSLSAPSSEWEICFQDKSGKPVIEKMSVAQIRKALQKGIIDLSADARSQGQGRFRKLSEISIFRDVNTQLSMIQVVTDEHRKQQQATQTRKLRHEQSPFWEQSWFLCGGLLALLAMALWYYWPLSQSQLLARGEALFSSDDISSRLKAKELYLLPLIKKYPESESAEIAGSMLLELDAQIATRRIESKLRLNRLPENDSERMAMKAYQLEQVGDRGAAIDKYRAIASVFSNDPQAHNIVAMAQLRLTKLSAESQPETEQHTFVINYLQTAEQEFQSGDLVSARTKWSQIVILYADEPSYSKYVSHAQARLENRESELPHGTQPVLPTNGSGSIQINTPHSESDEEN